MPLVLSLGGGEGRGEDGEKKKRKNCIHPASMFTSNPRLLLGSFSSDIFLHPHPSPPLLSSFPEPLQELFSSFISFPSIVFRDHSYHIKRGAFLSFPDVLSCPTPASAHLPERIFARDPLCSPGSFPRLCVAFRTSVST